MYSLSHDRTQPKFTSGIVLSFLGHIAGAFLMYHGVASSADDIKKNYQVFTVTLEGGERLGGISQVPVDSKKSKVLPNQLEAEQPTSEEKVAPKQPEKKLEAPSAVEDPAKKLREMAALEEKKKVEEKKKLEAEKQKAEAEKKLEEDKRKKEAEKARKEEEKRKAKEEEAREEKERAQRDKLLEKAIARAANRYKGESANAGGEGFGAASLGGKGMGGGTLASVEFIAYRNALEQHIKSGWRWLSAREQLVAQVQVTLLPTGAVQDAHIVASSGNSNFDDSAVRAVYKSSPVPPPPAALYDQFKVVRITFDSSK